VIEVGAALLAIIGWSIEAHRRADQRLDAAEGKIVLLVTELQRLRAHVVALEKRTANSGRSRVRN
jgi:hypothetical protein